jgi:hypothetical protein
MLSEMRRLPGQTGGTEGNRDSGKSQPSVLSRSVPAKLYDRRNHRIQMPTFIMSSEELFLEVGTAMP